MFNVLEFLCYAVPHSLGKSLVLVFQALGMEMLRYRSVRCALTDQKPATCLIVHSMRKNTFME
jgi:hypothetical protein